ncbi:hypothetical protein Salat_2514700 [Sesamum alatum]|uniref:Uncharacterized protein n=1 Tax=Sesamum alatum TaxID=300844 RepID=A0AAE1XSQ5_9LAMI|nr:hypothetical protein Salat_2514700 [Sesamum alatum]
MVDCSFARQLWALSNLLWRWVSGWTGGAAEWSWAVLQKLNREERQKFCALAWKIWQNRCSRLMEDRGQWPLEACASTITTLDNFKSVRAAFRVRVVDLFRLRYCYLFFLGWLFMLILMAFVLWLSLVLLIDVE